VTPGISDVTVRRAVPADAAELTRLRVALFDSIDMNRPSPAWWAATERVFTERLASDDAFAAFVVDDPEHPHRLIASAVGWVEMHLPSTRTLSPLHGRIVSVCVDESVRGRGHGRAVVEAVLGFFADRKVSRVDLESTAMAEKLYRSLGFTDSWGIALSWRGPTTPSQPTPTYSMAPAVSVANAHSADEAHCE
jgi:ribosomal protein S18 acetylase RimI-like enzyme